MAGLHKAPWHLLAGLQANHKLHLPIGFQQPLEVGVSHAAWKGSWAPAWAGVHAWFSFLVSGEARQVGSSGRPATLGEEEDPRVGYRDGRAPGDPSL